MMLNKTKFALAAVLISSTVMGAASAALANDSGENNMGGYVLPGSLDGVNPVYHPDIFGNPAVARSWGFYQARDGSWHVRPGYHRTW